MVVVDVKYKHGYISYHIFFQKLGVGEYVGKYIGLLGE